MHHLFSLLILICQIAFAQNSPCQNPRVRRSWHRLSNEERAEYIRAVQCLIETPGKGQSYFPAIQSRHDDFSSLHINQTTAPDFDAVGFPVVGPGIHENGVFLPWHRYMVWTYEEALINECGFTGTQPYWDWSIDTPENGKHFNESIIWDPVYGFGSNGEAGYVTTANTTVVGLTGSCVTDGPFANYSFTMGPTFNLDTPNPHCLVRDFNSTFAEDALQWNADIVPLLALTDYTEFYKGMGVSPAGAKNVFGRGVHPGGHSGTGGEMVNPWSSVNDPMFYMHHSMIDYLWWQWQGLSDDNFKAMGGSIFANGTGVITLDYPIYMTPFIAADVSIKDVMDVKNADGTGLLCYTYEDAGHALPTTTSRIKRRPNSATA